jgi:microsomal dipeptidase-like Zn-dependent dipeptidase
MTKDLPEWEKKVQTLLKVEILKRNLTYKQVSEKLAEIGVAESEPNIRNKLARGTFSAVFLVQCLEAIGCRSLQLSDG